MKYLVHSEITELPKEIILYEWQKQQQAPLACCGLRINKTHNEYTHIFWHLAQGIYCSIQLIFLKKLVRWIETNVKKKRK